MCSLSRAFTAVTAPKRGGLGGKLTRAWAAGFYYSGMVRPGAALALLVLIGEVSTLNPTFESCLKPVAEGVLAIGAAVVLIGFGGVRPTYLV